MLAIKAVLLNLLSLAAAFGVVVLVFQQGHGSQLWDVAPSGSVTAWIPLMIFAFLYGLSMDYEVFMLSRIREAYDETGSTEKAIELGLARTGKLVTSGALILMFAFLVLSTSPGYEIKPLAIGVGAGIILDATVIRALLVPGAHAADGRLELVDAELDAHAAARPSPGAVGRDRRLGRVGSQEVAASERLELLPGARRSGPPPLVDPLPVDEEARGRRLRRILGVGDLDRDGVRSRVVEHRRHVHAGVSGLEVRAVRAVVGEGHRAWPGCRRRWSPCSRSSACRRRRGNPSAAECRRTRCRCPRSPGSRATPPVARPPSVRCAGGGAGAST